MTLIIHFVGVSKHSEMASDIDIESQDSELSIRERLLRFISLSEMTSAFMTETILLKLDEMSLSEETCVAKGMTMEAIYWGKKAECKRESLTSI